MIIHLPLHCNATDHGKFMSYWPIFLCPWLKCLLGVWSPSYFISFEHLQIHIFCCFLCVLYRCAYGDIYCCVDGMYTYFISDISLSLFSLCDCGMTANLLYTIQDLVCTKCTCCTALCPAWSAAYTVTTLQHLADYGHKWFVVSDDMHFFHKAIVMELFEPM